MGTETFLDFSSKKIMLACLTFAILAMGHLCCAATNVCSDRSLQAITGQDMKIHSVASVADKEGKFRYCSISGTIRTRSDRTGGPHPGNARFRLDLPEKWNGRFVMFGVGGFGGNLKPSANPVDVAEALPEGYAVAINDGGHIATPGIEVDGSFAEMADGTINASAIADYFWRATHQSTILLKQFVRAFYRRNIDHSYFDGCSNGGRQGLIEAERFPGDYDGIIAGAPFFDLRLMLGDIKVQKAALASPESRLWPEDLQLIDQFVRAQCDRLDGEEDGVIQNPKRCKADFSALQCRDNFQSHCLKSGQLATLRAFVANTIDSRGNIIYPGFPVGNIFGGGGASLQFGTSSQPTPALGETWPEHQGPLEYQFDVEILKHLVLHESAFSFLKYPIGVDGVISAATLRRYDRATAEGGALDLVALRHYIDSGHKLLIYHGYADMAISPYSTIDLYQRLNDPAAVLFMVPNMGHCGGGGAPDQFDTLGLIHNWTEKAKKPGSILAASKQVPTKTLLICPYPKEARQVKPETGAATTSECIAP